MNQYFESQSSNGEDDGILAQKHPSNEDTDSFDYNTNESNSSQESQY